MSKVHKAIFASDIHFPRHDKRAVTLFMKVVKEWKPDSIDLVGDIDDADGTSRWADGTPDEVNNKISIDTKMVNDFLGDLRAIAPKADKHFHDGNHGWTRHNDYIRKKAPALEGIISPETLYDLKKHGFAWHSYQEPPVKRFKNLYVHHGVAISQHAGDSVRKDVDNFDVSILRGHSHRIGVYRKTSPLSGRDLSGYEIGHMCSISQMDYTNNWNWQMGFAIAHVVDGEAFVQICEIKDYTTVVDGKVVSV
jgi:hypothetical protein